MIVGALRIELHLPLAHSLKEKRAIIRPIIDGARHRFAVAVAETGFQDLWQRCEMAAAAVGSSERHVREVLDNVERFVWSFPEVDVISTGHRWLDDSD